MENTENTTKKLIEGLPNNPTICASLRERIQKHVVVTCNRIHLLCKIAHLPEEIETAIIQDFWDMAHNTYRGLRLSQAGIEYVAAHTSYQLWKNVHSPMLTLLLDEYTAIGTLLFAPTDTLKAELQNPEKVRQLLSHKDCTPVALYEAARSLNEDTAAMFNLAVTNRHVVFMLYTAEALLAPVEELHNVLPFYAAGNEDERKILLGKLLSDEDKLLQTAQATLERNAGRKRNPIAGIDDDCSITLTDDELSAQEQQAQEPIAEAITATTQENIAIAYADRTDREDTPATIAQNQVITEMLSTPLQVAPKFAETALRPLRQAIDEQKTIAENAISRLEAMKKNPRTTAQELKDAEQLARRAQELIASQTYIMQAFTGLQVIAAKMTPESSGGDYYGYKMSANEYIAACVGKDAAQHLTEKQRIGLLQAGNFISTLRAQTAEIHVTYRKTKDSSGKYKTKEERKKVTYTFNPAVYNFRTEESSEDVPLTACTQIHLQIYRNIVTGTRADYVQEIDDNGKKRQVKVLNPRPHITTEAQLYAFNTDEEKRLYNTLLSKGKRAEIGESLTEDGLLAEVFDYSSRIKIAHEKVLQERKTLQELIDDAGAEPTAEEQAGIDAQHGIVQAAEEQERKTRRSITAHRSRDAERLKEMLMKAQDTGVIKSYSREPAKNGKDYIWRWIRPTAEDIARQKKAPRIIAIEAAED